MDSLGWIWNSKPAVFNSFWIYECVNFVFQILVFNFQLWKKNQKKKTTSSARKVLKKHIKQLTHKGNFVFCSKDNNNMVAGAVHILTIPWKTKDKSIELQCKGLLIDCINASNKMDVSTCEIFSANINWMQ